MTDLYPPYVLAISCLIGEAGAEGRAGMVGVAEVIRNRMDRKYSSDGTVAGTVLRPKQFSCFDEPWRERLFKLRWNEPQVILARQAWEIAMQEVDGHRSNTTGGAVLYHTIDAPPRTVAPVWPPKWATAPGVRETARINHHVFYNDIGR